MNPRHLEIIRLCEEGVSLHASDPSRSLELMRKAMETAQSEAEWLTVLELLPAEEIGFLLSSYLWDYCSHMPKHGGACFREIPNSESVIFAAIGPASWKWHISILPQPEALQALYNIKGHFRVRFNADFS